MEDELYVASMLLHLGKENEMDPEEIAELIWELHKPEIVTEIASRAIGSSEHQPQRLSVLSMGNITLLIEPML